MLYRALCIIYWPSMYSNWSYSLETLIWVKINDFLSLVTLKFDGWPWKLIDNPFCGTSKFLQHFVHNFIIICEFKLEWHSGKEQSWVLTSVTLTFELWPLSFAWTSLLSLGITPENVMTMQSQEHCEKGVTDGRMDRETYGRTDGHKCSWSCLVSAKYCLLRDELLTGFIELCNNIRNCMYMIIIDCNMEVANCMDLNGY